MVKKTPLFYIAIGSYKSPRLFASHHWTVIEVKFKQYKKSDKLYGGYWLARKL